MRYNNNAARHILFERALAWKPNVSDQDNRHSKSHIGITKIVGSVLLTAGLQLTPMFVPEVYAVDIPMTVRDIPATMRMEDAPPEQSSEVTLISGVQYYDVVLGEYS